MILPSITRSCRVFAQRSKSLVERATCSACAKRSGRKQGGALVGPLRAAHPALGDRSAVEPSVGTRAHALQCSDGCEPCGSDWGGSWRDRRSWRRSRQRLRPRTPTAAAAHGRPPPMETGDASSCLQRAPDSCEAAFQCPMGVVRQVAGPGSHSRRLASELCRSARFLDEVQRSRCCREHCWPADRSRGCGHPAARHVRVGNALHDVDEDGGPEASGPRRRLLPPLRGSC